jgi:hypothetical protein
MTPLDLIWTGAVVSLPTGQSFGEVITKVTSAQVIGGWIGATVIVGASGAMALSETLHRPRKWRLVQESPFSVFLPKSHSAELGASRKI